MNMDREDYTDFSTYACLANLADMHTLDTQVETSDFRSELMTAAHDLLGWEFKVERKNSVSDWTTSATFGGRIVGFLYGNNYQALFSGKTPEGSTMAFDDMFRVGFSAFCRVQYTGERYKWNVPMVGSASELRMRASVLGVDMPWLTVSRDLCELTECMI